LFVVILKLYFVHTFLKFEGNFITKRTEPIILKLFVLILPNMKRMPAHTILNKNIFLLFLRQFFVIYESMCKIQTFTHFHYFIKLVIIYYTFFSSESLIFQL